MYTSMEIEKPYTYAGFATFKFFEEYKGFIYFMCGRFFFPTHYVQLAHMQTNTPQRLVHFEQLKRTSIWLV